MIILKSLWRQKPLLKSQKCRTCYCLQGPSERYAPLGLSFPPLPRRAPFSRSRGRLRRSEGPCRPVMFGWRIFQCLAMPIWHWTEPNKWQMILRQITMSLENVTTLAGQVNTDPVRHSCRMDKSPLIFDPLGNGSPVLHIDNQKVS